MHAVLYWSIEYNGSNQVIYCKLLLCSRHSKHAGTAWPACSAEHPLRPCTVYTTTISQALGKPGWADSSRGAGDGCPMQVVNSWALGWSSDPWSEWSAACDCYNVLFYIITHYIVILHSSLLPIITVSINTLLLHIITSAIITYYYSFIITYYYINITLLLHQYYIFITLLLHHNYIIITFTIITLLLHHYYIIITLIIIMYFYNWIIIYYYIIITLLLHHYYVISSSLLQKGNHVILIALLHVMQTACLYYYIITMHYCVIITQTSIIIHYYPFQSPKLADALQLVYIVAAIRVSFKFLFVFQGLCVCCQSASSVCVSLSQQWPSHWAVQHNLGDEIWKPLTVGPCFQVFLKVQGKTRAKHFLGLLLWGCEFTTITPMCQASTCNWVLDLGPTPSAPK